MKSNKEYKIGDVMGDWILDYKLTLWEKIWWPIKWKVEAVSYFFRKIGQTIKNGFPDEQAFDFYSHCAKWCLPRLKSLRNHIHGHPGNISFEEWQLIIDKIIWSMENHDNAPEPIKPDDYVSGMKVVDIRNGRPLWSSVDERPIDFTPLEEHDKRVQEGFDLFGKYFRHLWD